VVASGGRGRIAGAVDEERSRDGESDDVDEPLIFAGCKNQRRAPQCVTDRAVAAMTEAPGQWWEISR
jgi:hypothetical protein